MPGSNIAVLVDGVQTLPLYWMFGITQEPIPRFGSGAVRFQYEEPQLKPSPFRCDQDTLEKATSDWQFACSAVKSWNYYLTQYMYYCQFKDDATRALVTALNDHAELLSKICDLRLGLDPTPFGRLFFGLIQISQVQSEYRNDDERQAKYDHYAEQLDSTHNKMTDHLLNVEQLCQRMLRVMESKKNEWASLPKLFIGTADANSPSMESGLVLFCSYSHKDEILRDGLESHLAMLRREKAIAIWHDRKITGGQEWKGEISTHLSKSDIILLLVSADFINSDYCYDVEMSAALKQHESKVSRVIPVILRACDWTSSPFGALQAFPKDGSPITSWGNIDEAFTDVAKRLRVTVDEIKQQRTRPGAA